MNRAVIIVTCDANKEWLSNMLKTIPIDVFVEYNFHVFNNRNKGGYELAAIKWAYEQGFDEFVLLHDTMEIKDVELFKRVFETPGSVSFGNNYFMYMGKYEKTILDKMSIPVVSTKMEAVNNEVRGDGFCKQYTELSRPTILCPDLKDTQVFEDRYGKKCMVLETVWFRKYKRTWDTAMIKAGD